MASIGCPIVGDTAYGRRSADKTIFPAPDRQMLHAQRLELRHPTTRKSMTFEAPLPECFNRYLADRPASYIGSPMV
jgi:23S rRNA pseudouridine1911/1915/1917 synthase